ncbi:hypothetical protein AgCh_011939 [Apium graveolens]
MMQRSKVATLGFLKDKVKKRSLSWDGKFISQGGKEVLVKSVLQSLPTYAMSVFLLPLEITKDLERSISRFWWNTKKNVSRSIHWMSWERLSRHKSCGGMGFRDFRDFNLAMLGKQGWRFIKNPHSLVSRVFKAKYFPDSTFLEAKAGSNPSFVWRSIWEARHVISAGMRWKIGSGNSVNIIGQPWLLDEHNPYITSSAQGLENFKVSALMSMEHRGWDEEILVDMFNAHDQQCIRRIQLPENSNEDEAYWSKEATGQYTVRSAYRLLQEQKNLWRREDQSSTWRKTWRMKAPPKILNFMWRALSNCLPTKVSLLQKNMDVNPVCQVCHRGEETVEHILGSCDLAVQCWQQIIPQVLFSGNMSFYQWWQRILEVCDNEKRAQIAAVCWSLWKARNELTWNKNFTRLNVVIAQAKQFLLQWSIAQKSKPQSHFPYYVEGDGQEVWVAPQIEYMKISADAAVFNEYNSTGLGLIARDDNGELIQARTQYKAGMISSTMAEALAIKEALSWIKAMGWSKVLVESDCLIAIQAIRSKAPLLSPFGQVIQDCRKMLEDLNTVSLFFVKQSANMAAHELARLSYFFPDRVFDRISIPIGVKNVLRSDLSI